MFPSPRDAVRPDAMRSAPCAPTVDIVAAETGPGVIDGRAGTLATAVLTMELQRGVVGDLSTMGQLQEAVAAADLLGSVRRLLEAARSASIPVIHATVGWRSDRRGTPLVTPIARHLAENPAQMLEGSSAVDLEPKIGADVAVDLISHRQHGMTPFTGTSLDALVRSLGVSRLVVCGVSLNVGVLGAVLEAVGLGYEVTVPTDAVVGVPADYGAAVIRNSLSHVATLTTTEHLARRWGEPRTATRTE